MIRWLSILLALALATGASAEKKEVNLWVARDVAPGPKIRLTINTLNLPVVQMKAYRIEGIEWLIRQQFTSDHPAPSGTPGAAWSVTVASVKERHNPAQVDIWRRKQVNLPVLPPGLYLLVASGGDGNAWAMVNVTNLSVVVKRSPQRALVWVTDAKTGATVGGASVAIYTESVHKLAEGRTAGDGVSQIPIGPGQTQTVIVQRGRDLAAVATGVANPDGRLDVHFQTDRPIYRPGQTVLYKAILRTTKGRGYLPVANSECAVEVRDGKDNRIWHGTLRASAIGTLAGQVDVPPEGVLGNYSIVVKNGDQTAYGSFAVAEYRKPEYKVTLTPQQKRYLAGEDVAFDLQATYYFGAPVPQAAVTYSVRRSANYYGNYGAEEQYNDGNLYARDTYAGEDFIAQGTVYTDDAGKVAIPFKTKAEAPDSTYSVSCTVQDASRRQVAAASSVPVYAAAIRIAMSTDVLFTPLGSNVPVKVTAVDLDGKPVAAKVTLVVKEPVWIEKEGRYRFKELARTVVNVPKSGKATAKVPALAQDELTVSASAPDGSGRTATAEMPLWVVGPHERAQRDRQPNISIRLDRRTYAPGDAVKAWIGTNVGKRPMLVAAEGMDVWQYTVVPPGKKSFVWSFKTSLAMSPNAYVTAMQWAPRQMVSANAMVPLPDLSRKLMVKLTPDKTAYRPGDKARYRVETLDDHGKPIAAELALSVVDEAIYALRADTTADPYQNYWSYRGNYVQTQVSAPEELSGGAYQAAEGGRFGGQRRPKLASVRERFLDTAYWNAFVNTGPDGAGTVEVEMPGNLTTWRATGRAITDDTRGGSGVSSVTVSRPVMLRLATPRQMARGDRLVLIGTVNNRTDKEREFVTNLHGEGIAVGGGEKRVTVKAGGEGTVEWQLTANSLPENGSAVLTGSVLAADAGPNETEELSDQLRVSLRIVPEGTQTRIVVGGVVPDSKTVTVDLPRDRLEPSTTAFITLRTGLQQVADDLAHGILDTRRYGTAGAAQQLRAAALVGRPKDDKVVTDALAALSRYQHGDGMWGWWDDDPDDPFLTANVLQALGAAQAAGYEVPEPLAKRGVAGASRYFGQTNLWEHRAVLASAIASVDGAAAGPQVDEVARRGTHLSPYAQLALARALVDLGKPDDARQLVQSVTQGTVAGPETAYIEVGDHAGWEATTAETTGLALSLLVRLHLQPELQPKLAIWLAMPDEAAWRCADEQVRALVALRDYLRDHPSPAEVGGVTVTVNGTKLDVSVQGVDKPFTIPISRDLLRDSNTIEIRRTGGGEAFYSVEARVFRRADEETMSGIRVLRRYDSRSEAGLWNEVRGPVKPSDPVRCTVVIWPDDRPDFIRVNEPLPAGFEYLETEWSGYWAREEVRDGAIVHDVRGGGRPLVFRYFIRAESEGQLLAVPATAEVIRRPAVRGNSASSPVEVRK